MTDPRVLSELSEIASRLQLEGKLLSSDQLETYYSRFRERFGPEAISNLDGDELLNRTMSIADNHDSMMYWLEFKNDGVFQTTIFGSIKGGGAHKFGVFYSTIGQWLRGGSANQTTLSESQAIDYAREQRRQLTLCCSILQQRAGIVTDDQYRELQARLAQAGPQLVGSAWAHKYFHMMFPEVVDDFHLEELQRFHLIRCLQEPPAGDGRYICSGRLQHVALELNVPINYATRALNERDGKAAYGYWRVDTSNGSRFSADLSNAIVTCGWIRQEDLSRVRTIPNRTTRQDSILQLLAQGDEHLAADPQAVKRVAKQLDLFMTDMAPRDVVVAMDGGLVVALGRVAGEYYYDNYLDFAHAVPVNWYSRDQWRLTPPEGGNAALARLHRFAANRVEIERRLLGATPIEARRPVESNTDQIEFAPVPTAPPSQLSGIQARIDQVLRRKGQVILYGPPGTGKTYWAQTTSCELAARSWYRKSWDMTSEPERAIIQGTAVRMCSFHPAYGYEDFLEAYRPTTTTGQLLFELRDGAFKTLCAEAISDPAHNYYLVIDEINRGDIPRIFGELLTLLEKDKRGRRMLLPLTGEEFSIPQNVFVIGTMNTADRSIALLDAALRRRFGFIELMPDYDILKPSVIEGLPLSPWLKALNGSIVSNLGADGRNLQIGHSYFLTSSGEPITDAATFARIVREDIIPLLEEYSYNDFGLLVKLLGKQVVDPVLQRIDDTLFEPDRYGDLAEALTQTYSEIISTPEAVEAETIEEDPPLEEEEIDEQP